MLYRIFAALIVGFWLVMTGMLVRLEIAPEKSTVLEVPVAHVVRLMFANAQPSSLNIVENGLPIGNISLQPQSEPGYRVLRFAGSLWLRLPMIPKQRVAWDGTTTFDRALNAQSAHLEVTMREPSTHTMISVNEQPNILHYEVTQNGNALANADVSLTREGLMTATEQLGIDPNALAAFGQNAPSSLRVSAKETTRRYREETIAVFHISIQQSGAPIADIYVSQLGQVLEATTPFGYGLIAPN